MVEAVHTQRRASKLVYVHVQGKINRQGAWQTSSADDALADLLCPRSASVRCMVYERQCLENTPPPRLSGR